MPEYVHIRKADGSEASVIESEFQKHYPDVKYKVLGPETPEAFTATGIPTPRKARPKPKSKAAAPIAPVDENAPEETAG